MPERQKIERRWTFLEIYQGKLVERSKTAQNGFALTTVKDKEGKEVGSIYLRTVSGLEQFLLKDVTYRKKELADGKVIKNLDLILQDATDSTVIYKIQFSYPSVIASVFMKLLPNMPFGQPLDINIYPEKGTKNAQMFVSYHEGDEKVNVKHAFTKEFPNGMPPAKKYDDEWDYREQSSWLLKQASDIKAKLKEFWDQNGEMFETVPKEPVVTTAGLLDTETPLEEIAANSESRLSPAAQETWNKATQGSKFKDSGDDDDLPF